MEKTSWEGFGAAVPLGTTAQMFIGSPLTGRIGGPPPLTLLTVLPTITLP